MNKQLIFEDATNGLWAQKAFSMNIELFDNEVEAWESAYSNIGQDEPDRQEALEFWAVSRDLAHWLSEPVNNDILSDDKKREFIGGLN